jgi:hypothetical protein
MTSEIRANTIKNRVGLGTVSYTNTGIVVSGIVTANSFEGDGSSLTGIDATTLKDSAGNIKIQAQASGAIHSGISTFNDDVRFITANGGNILIDKSDNTIRLGQSVGLFYGADKMWMQHNGSVGYLHNVTGSLYIRNEDSSGDIYIQGKSGEHSIICNYDGDVQLYHDAGLRLSTTSGGISVSGNISATGNLSLGGTLYLTDAIEHTDDSNTKIRFPSNDSITFETAGTERLRIFSNGHVNIGAGSSGSGLSPLLHLHKNASNSSAYFHITNNDTGITNNDGFLLGINPSGDCLVFNKDSTPIRFATAGTERLRITSDGKIGIGEDNPDGNYLLIRAASTVGTTKGHIMLTGDSATNGQGPQIVFSESGSGSNFAGAYIGHAREGSNSQGSLIFATRATSGDANTVPTERLRIMSDGEIKINHTQSSTPLNNTFISIWDANSDSSAIDASGVSKNYAMISLHNYGTGVPGDTTGIAFGAGTGFSYTKGSIAFQRTGSYGLGDLVFLTNNDSDTTMVNDGDERMRITKEGDIYGPGGGRKNWFDNGSFDCRGGRRANTSMDYGNHHAYGWVTDRFMSRNSVQWSRSTNVPTGKGFSYSTLTNGAGGQIMQAVELPDYGDMGVFTPGSYWCVSFWSTATCNPSGAAFSYDLGSTKTDIPVAMGGAYTSTGETAAGTSTGTFTRYYKVFGPMPSSIISGATGAYWKWGFSQQGYTTGFQLERVPTSTSKPTPYEHVHPAVTTARCRRYCFQNVNSRLFNGYKRHDSNIHWSEIFPVPPTHMPSGSNQSANPYGIILHDGGLLTNFQSILQNPGVNSVTLSEFDHRSGRVIIVGSTSYSPTHVTVPSWESQEYEIGHGFF